jgi:hypothetical protein
VTRSEKGEVALMRTFHQDGAVELRESTFSSTGAPSVGAFVNRIFKGSSGPPDTTRVQIVDEKRTLGERVLDCKRVSFVYKEGTKRVEGRFWLSSEVRAPGVVAAELEAHYMNEDHGVSFELAGYGDVEKTLWGKTLDELVPAGK